MSFAITSSSPASFEVLHAVSQRLADDFIDEDMSEIGGVRVDETDEGNVACLLHQPFAGGLQLMAQRPGCRRIKMQSGAGLGPLVAWHAGSSSPDAVMSWLDQTVQLAATLDA